MRKRLIPACLLIAYSALLVRLLVFKINLITIGHMRFKFTDHGTGPANFIPFKTIWPYLRGDHGWFIATLNVAGNIALFIPVGFLAPLVWRKMTWQKSLILAVAAGLAIEGMEAVFRVGIFDIDDVILNGLGVMIGWFVFRMVPLTALPEKKKLSGIKFLETSDLLTDADITNLEKEFSLKLPGEFREHYLKYNGGYPEKRKYKWNDGSTTRINLFLPIKYKDFGLLEETYKNLVEIEPYLPKGIVPFATDDGGNLFCISTRENDYGRIYYCNNDHYNIDNNEECLTLADKRFNEFIANFI